jgi:glucan phosphoethanolaminetransferase (alkaline phosphatase superfamily)
MGEEIMEKIKSIILGVITLALQIWLWWFLDRVFNYQQSTFTWIWLALLASFMVSVTTFFFLTDKMRWLSEIIIASSALSYFIISDKNHFIWMGGILFVALTFWFHLRLHAEAKSRLDFSVTRVVSGSVSLLVLALLLLIGFNIYYNVQNKFQNNPDEFYNQLGKQAARSVPYFTKNLPDEVNLNEPFADYLNKQAETDPRFQEAGQFEREVILNEIRTNFQRQFQVSANDNQTLAEIMAAVAINRVREATAPFEMYLPLIFTIIIVGLLLSFAFLLKWLIILISWGVFHILRLTGFFKLETVVVEVKKLVI